MAKTADKTPAEMPWTEPEGWRPEAGDVLKGTVTNIDRGWSDYLNGFYPLITVKDDEGNETAVHCFQHVLKDRLMQLQPKIGEEITIMYGGKRPTRDGKREVAVYKVEVPGRDGADVWQSLGAQQSQAAQVGTPTVPAQGQLGQDEDIPF